MPRGWEKERGRGGILRDREGGGEEGVCHQGKGKGVEGVFQEIWGIVGYDTRWGKGKEKRGVPKRVHQGEKSSA